MKKLSGYLLVGVSLSGGLIACSGSVTEPDLNGGQGTKASGGNQSGDANNAGGAGAVGLDDSGTNGLGAASSGASSSVGDADFGYYFTAGAWRGYGFTDSGPAEGGVVSDVSGAFVSGSASACVSGTLAEAYGSLGILGMSVNQGEGSEIRGEWLPGDYKGVKIQTSQKVQSGLRMELLTASGDGYCSVLSGDSATLPWSSFRSECWGNNGVVYDPTTPIVAVQFYAPGDVNGAVSFDYCVDKLEPVKDAGPVIDPNHKFVGNITTYGQVRSDFVDYWDQITPENEGKWGSVEGSRDQYNWGGLDAAYKYAKDHGIPFKQHTFVWGSQAPQWINGLSSSEQAAEIEEWIKDYCERYPETELIDVVNEATPGHAPADYARSAFGDDWIIKSFELAREYCPNSILILNDYNVLTWNTDGFINMARPAVEAGVVDAIGLQAHGFATWSLNDLKANFNKVLGLGLPIYISEYDVDLANDEQQLNVMKEQFTYFYEHPSVKGITLWGYLVGGTWVPNSGLIHDNGSQRPAMTWLMDYLNR